MNVGGEESVVYIGRKYKGCVKTRSFWSTLDAVVAHRTQSIELDMLRKF